MNVAAGPELAAAVTNAGGLGVIGGIGYTPKILRQQVRVIPLLGPTVNISDEHKELMPLS
jgi:NAD(P)H-dependent flavin oxidoreductase YrpB (nitropropane dioxygenase family)